MIFFVLAILMIIGEVEVYKNYYHDGWVDREKMKVNSTGDRYYDPDDGEWHKI